MKRNPTIAQVRAKKRTPIYAIFDNIRSLYNVGAMFRTSDAALMEKVFLTGVTGTPPHKEIDKSALGATEVVPWEYRKDTVELLEELKSQGIFIVALERAENAKLYNDFPYNFPACLVVGNEVSGISPETLSLCDAIVEIPMLGRAHSLNVATAYGIALFEMLRHYQANA